jgi:hypothetical protein
MGMVVRGMLLGSSRIGTMQINVAFFIIKRKLPSVQGALSSRLEKGSKHPVSSGGLQDGMNDKSTWYDEQSALSESYIRDQRTLLGSMAR